MRKTKIVATLGPSTNTVEKIKELIEAGLNAARINFSHGSHESHSAMINMFKQAREELNANVALVLDTKGPEIRTKSLNGGSSVQLEQGNLFTITTNDIVGDEYRVAVTYSDFAKDLKKDDVILIDDGLIELKVKEINGSDVICYIVNSGMLGENKGVNLPNTSVSLPALTEKDIQDIVFGIKMDFDFIAASFIRSAADVNTIRNVLKENNSEHIKIISKIENREGVDNIDEILDVTDGIMVARGDLGVEIPPEEVPMIQKRLINKTREKGKLVITATQMLESMVVNPRPTRAEVSDVANAIYDGTDAIMLSGETAKGDYPVESVDMMSRIALQTEQDIDYNNNILMKANKLSKSVTNTISHAACVAAAELNSKCIISITKTGYTARNVSKIRPQSQIIAITQDEVVKRQLQLTWGTIPILSKSNLIEEAVKLTVETDIVKKGDTVAIVLGVPFGKGGKTNTLKLHIIGDEIV